MSYTKTTWVNNQAPAINADNLNHMEQGIESAHNQIDINTSDIDSLETQVQTNTQNIASEASARQSTDTSLQSQIDQLIAPTGEAPTPAEIENARIGAPPESTVYPTLGDAIRGQVTDLKSDINYNESNIVNNDFNIYDLLTGESIERTVYPVWESGNWSTGGESADSTKIRTKEIDFTEYYTKYITATNQKVVTVKIPSDVTAGVFGLDSNDTVVVYRGLSGPVTDTQNYPISTVKIRMVAFYNDRRTITHPPTLGDTISMKVLFNTTWRPLTTDDYSDLGERVINSNIHLLPNFASVVGREWNLYFCQLFEAIDWKTTGLIPRVDFTGSGGRMYDDRYSIIATTAGTYAIRIKILKIINGAEVEIYNSDFLTFKVYADTALGTAKKALFLGDSRTDFSRICTYARNQLGSNLTLLGTRGTSPYFHEGRSSWSAKMYCTQSSYGGVSNAFWNPNTSKFDFSYYMTQQGYSGVDFVNILLGVNGEYSDEEVTYIGEIVDSIHDYDSAIIISIMTEYQLPMSAYYTGWYLIALRSRLFFNKLKTAFSNKESENVYLLGAGYQIDNYYDFSRSNVQASQLNTQQITVITDNVHCTYGYDKLSNAWLMFFKSML